MRYIKFSFDFINEKPKFQVKLLHFVSKKAKKCCFSSIEINLRDKSIVSKLKWFIIDQK